MKTCAYHGHERKQHNVDHQRTLGALEVTYHTDLERWRLRVDALETPLALREKESIDRRARADNNHAQLTKFTEQLNAFTTTRAAEVDEAMNVCTERERLRVERDAARRELNLVQTSTGALIAEKESQIVPLEDTVIDLRCLQEDGNSP